VPEFGYTLPLIAMILAAPAAMAQPEVTPAGAPASPAITAVAAVAATPTVPAAPAPVSVTAGDAAVVPASAPAPACELHVWPAARVAATTQGMGASFGLLGALVDIAAHADQNKRDTAFITGALDAQAQARVLRDLDLPTQLHLPPSRVVIHDQGIDLKADNPNRLSNSTAQCYAEFVVRSLMYTKSAMYKGQMRTFLQMRRFDGTTIKADFRDSKHENLQVKLPKEGEDTGPATDQLLSAFRGDVAYFDDKFARKYK
jgi:hypothetical protein